MSHTSTPARHVGGVGHEGEDRGRVGDRRAEDMHAHPQRVAHVALELVETEEAYGASMHLLASTLVAPLQRADVTILPAPLVTKIFSSTTRIADVSRDLSAALRPVLKPGAYNAADAPVGAVLLSSLRSQGGLLSGSRFAEAHVQYVNNFEHGIEHDIVFNMVFDLYNIHIVNVDKYIHQFDVNSGQMCEQSKHIAFGSMPGIVNCRPVWFFFSTVRKYMQRL